MNEPENDLQSGSRLTELEGQCGELRRMVNMLFGALVLTSFSLTAYLGLQGKRAAQESVDARHELDYYAQLVQQDDAAIQTFYSRLQEFGRTHPDVVNRILSKYKVNTPPAGK
jgi:hypothetical protein